MPWPKGKKFSPDHIKKRSESLKSSGKRRKKPIILDGLEYWKCGTCGIFKPAVEFYEDGKTFSGISSVCKSCHTKCSIATRNKDNHREVCAEYQRRNRIKNIDKIREKEKLSSRKRRESDSLKIKARLELNNALKRGDIIKPIKCESCNEIKKLSGHHKDYSKPFEVEWLCNRCHGKKHRIFQIVEFKKV